jgi:hypothetical protein
MVAVKPHRELPDRLDLLIRRRPVQRPDGLPQNPPEQPNIVPQGIIKRMGSRFHDNIIHGRIKPCCTAIANYF